MKMTNITYNPSDPITRVTSGYDRPEDLHELIVGGNRELIGYREQCERYAYEYHEHQIYLIRKLVVK